MAFQKYDLTFPIHQIIFIGISWPSPNWQVTSKQIFRTHELMILPPKGDYIVQLLLFQRLMVPQKGCLSQFYVNAAELRCLPSTSPGCCRSAGTRCPDIAVQSIHPRNYSCVTCMCIYYKWMKTECKRWLKYKDAPNVAHIQRPEAVAIINAVCKIEGAASQQGPHHATGPSSNSSQHMPLRQVGMQSQDR